MISIPIEEGEAFDRLSILAIKSELFPTEENANQLIDFFILLCRQIKTVNSVLASPEYQSLKEINREIFETIEKIRECQDGDYCSAAYLDDLNTVRSINKKHLHKRFFGAESREFKTK